MHLSFLEYLRCPQTGEALHLEITERQGNFVRSGVLRSSVAEYPIVRGIPRFAGWNVSNYTKSFGYQWNKWSRVQFESENIGQSMEGHTTNMFDRIVGYDTSDLKGKLILDVGCGPGRFIDVVRMRGGRVIGVDYSAAVEAAARNFAGDKEVLICQADALNLPIRSRTVDGAYSIGVLHHTPDPERGFRQIIGTVREGGWVSVVVYGKGGYYDSPRVALWRSLFRALSPMLGVRPPLLYSYLGAYVIYPLGKVPGLGHLLRLVFPVVRLADPQWRLLDTFDSVTPTYQSAHESYEVFRWFKHAGLVDIEPSNWGFSAYHGRIPL